jgi:Uma2 family endonuclease
MTSLLVNEQMPLPIDLSSLITMSKLSDQQFYDFCRTNPDLRIERNANGEIIVRPPIFADTGNRNGRKNRQVYIYRPNREPEFLDKPEFVSCEPEMPMFALKMAKIW